MLAEATRIAQILLSIGAVKLQPEEPFTWASGRLSPIYCDNRLVLSHPNERDEVKGALLNASKKYNEFDVVAGVATAGIPHGALLADALNLPFIYIRSSSKSHGRKNQVEGQLKAGQRVLVIEDLISTGGSSLAAVDVVKEKGGKVVGVLSIFTYSLPESLRRFADAECPLNSLTTYDTLVQIAAEEGYITSNHLSILNSWKEDPTAWSDERKKD